VQSKQPPLAVEAAACEVAPSFDDVDRRSRQLTSPASMPAVGQAGVEVEGRLAQPVIPVSNLPSWKQSSKGCAAMRHSEPERGHRRLSRRCPRMANSNSPIDDDCYNLTRLRALGYLRPQCAQ
jgi:hypothetical protein